MEFECILERQEILGRGHPYQSPNHYIYQVNSKIQIMYRNVALACFLGIAVLSCKQENADTNRTVIVSGQYLNTQVPVVSVYQTSEEIGSDSLDAEGHFHITFELDAPAYLAASNGRNRVLLYLTPGDSIHLSADLAHFDSTLSISGTKAIEANYLKDKSKLMAETGMNNFMKLMSHEKEAYFALKDSLFDLVRERYNGLSENNQTDPGFLKLEGAYFDFRSLYMDNLYPLYFAHIHEVESDSIDFPTGRIKEDINNIPTDRADLLPLFAYTDLLEIRINDLVGEWLKDTTLYNMENYYEVLSFLAIDTLFTNPEVREHLQYSMLRDKISYKGPHKMEQMIESFRSTAKNTGNLALLDMAIAKWDHILPGKEVPDFTFVDIEGEAKKLSDLRGQLVYIDVWATWCGPCIAEHPDWDKLLDEYADKPVAFLAVSVDNTRAQWEKMLAEKSLKGIHWYADNNWESDLAKHFMIRGIPRFLLLDAEGQVIEPSADRPSGLIRKTLDKALEKMTVG